MLTGKPFSVLSKRQQRRRKATLKTSITNCLNSCKAANGLKTVSVTLKTKDDHKINLECMNGSSEDKENQSSITDVEGVCYQSPKSILYLLMKYGVSMEFYHELSMMFKSMPRTYQVST